MLVHAFLGVLLATALLAAAGLKLTDRTATAIAAATFGLHGALARWLWLPLAAVESALAAGLLANVAAAAPAAAALLAAFTAAQAIAIAAGRHGAPCGCFGARGRVSWGSVARTGLLAAAAALLAFGAPGVDSDGGPAPLPAVILAPAIAGAIVLRGRRPAGALEIDGEGPPLGSALHLGDGVRLALFTSADCRLCRALIPRARRLGAAVLDEREHAGAWAAAAVPGAPFAVALASDGTVLAKGTVNTRAQLGSVLAAGLDRAQASAWRSEPRMPVPHPRDATQPSEQTTRPGASSRRGFLTTASAAVAALTAGRLVGSLVAPGDAEAYHFCGHIYTTDGCPHPTGLPRIDRDGRPLRARDGKPVDDLGRLVDRAGAPITEAGVPLLDPDGRAQPAATRTPICRAAGKRHRIAVQTDGSWYRCCDGHVRKLLDCCTTSKRRINGDRALRGYCYGKRHVFCVMYFQTKVPC